MTGIQSFPSYDKLPFIIDTALAKAKGGKIRNHSELVDPKTGELIENATTNHEGEFDPTRFVKMYHRGFPNLGELNPSGLRVMIYIMSTMGRNVEKISIDIPECLQFCGYKARNPMYKGLVNLLENGIIAVATGQQSYWINPNVFYNGNPVETVKAQVKSPPSRFIRWKDMKGKPYVGDEGSVSERLNQ